MIGVQAGIMGVDGDLAFDRAYHIVPFLAWVPNLILAEVIIDRTTSRAVGPNTAGADRRSEPQHDDGGYPRCARCRRTHHGQAPRPQPGRLDRRVRRRPRPGRRQPAGGGRAASCTSGCSPRRSARRMVGDVADETTERRGQRLHPEAGVDGIGATIMGRNMFGPVRGLGRTRRGVERLVGAPSRRTTTRCSCSPTTPGRRSR
ncbi:MAG: hypothetical protein V9G12_24870 [Microthrixaceae bacterium]